MDAINLPLPQGVSHAQHIGGMRELCFYSIGTDSHLARWDTVIDGVQYHVLKEVSASVVNPPKFMRAEREDSKAQLIEMSLKNKAA